MTEDEDAILPTQSPVEDFPLRNNDIDKTGSRRERRHNNFISKVNGDAQINFSLSLSISRSDSEMSNNPQDQENGQSNTAKVIAGSIVGEVIDRAVAEVEKHSKLREIDSTPTDQHKNESSEVSFTEDEPGGVILGTEKDSLSQDRGLQEEILPTVSVSPPELIRDDTFEVMDIEAEDAGPSIAQCDDKQDIESQDDSTRDKLDKLTTSSVPENEIMEDGLFEDTNYFQGTSNYEHAESVISDTSSAIDQNDLIPKVSVNILNASFFSTKLINGNIVFSRDYDIASLTLSLICEGNQSVSWEHKISGGKGSEKVFETQQFFTDYIDLIYKEGADDKTLMFVFSYQFPPNLPSSFSYYQNDDKSLSAVIEYSFILLDIKENQIIAKKTINLYEAPAYHYLTKPKKDSLKVFYLSCINKGTLSLKAELDRGCYFVGDIAQIRCCIKNEPGERISEIQVFLCRYLYFKDRKFHHYNARHVLFNQNFYELSELKGSDKTNITMLPFEIKEIGTQSVSGSQFISCCYVIRVAIRTKSGYDLFVDLDVVLYNRNPTGDIFTKSNGDIALSLEGQYSNFMPTISGSLQNHYSFSNKRNGVLPKGETVLKKRFASHCSIKRGENEHLNAEEDAIEGQDTNDTKRGEKHKENAEQQMDKQLLEDKNLIENESVFEDGDEKSVDKHKNQYIQDVELPRFPEDYLPVSETDEIKESDIIVQL